MSPLVYICMHFKVVWCLHYNWQPGTCKHRTTHRRRKQFHLGGGGGGQRNIHVHCDRGDLRCMYEVARVKLGIGMRIRCLTRSTWKSKWRSSKRWRDGLECWFIHLSLLLLFALYIYRCRTPWQISPGLKGLPAKN